MTMDTIIERFKKLNIEMDLNEFTIKKRRKEATLHDICFFFFKQKTAYEIGQ